MATLERERDENGILITKVVMSYSEYKTLANCARVKLQKEKDRITRLFEKYNGKHEVGIATSRDEDKLIMYTDMLDDIRSIEKDFKTILITIQ